MIQLMLQGRYTQVRLYHVRMAFSTDMDSVGRFAFRKLWVLFTTILAVWWARLRHRPQVLYYPPAGPEMVPVLRDIVLLCATRWAFRRTVFHFHASGISTLEAMLNPVLRTLFRWAYRRPDLCIRTAPQNPDDGAALGAARSVVVPNGIPDVRGTVPERTAAPSQPLTILFTGVLIPSKGVRVLLEAFAQLVAGGVDARLQLMGRWGDPGFERECMEFVHEQGLEGHVTSLGVLMDQAKHTAFAACDIFCFPSFFEAESFGLVVAEAMQFAKPVVSTHWRGIPSVVADGESGFLVPVRDPAAVAEKLRLLAVDPALRQRMGAAGRRIFEERFTLEAFYRSMENELAVMRS